ncbi:hypothetical protein [Citreimonas salinaria]|uniref:Membrane-anchored ribosome-binding protein, inhibits growth in stationary phase, ElaB/YqjD/DUF883 family n=1 Tax=Citreimonas salinaria TaxID=321339 RepID=A0A1H3J7U5_9RHOB|nr:hypothetical protein [Citreimonas salinaria]SDY35244.1 Membrane-anchored ribosome-binding protein, inhibits growth in stationary phase, ElaB/YqjD/DUF883 family [Citreimonas salinaria]
MERTHESFGHAQPDALGTPTGDHKPSMSDRAREQVNAGRESMQQASQKISETAATATEQGTAFVRENPGLALAGALGIGVLIGLAIRERY